MPALPDVNKVIRIAISGHISVNNPWVTRFFLSFSGANPSTADLDTYASGVLGTFDTDLKALCDGATHADQCEVVDLTSPTSAISIASDDIGGTRSGGNTPADLCVVVSYQVARRYRGGHPRGYWPFGVVEDFDTTYTWSSDFLDAVNTGLGNFFDDLNGGGWGGAGTLKHVNVSYYQGFTVVTNPTTGRASNVPTLRGAPLVDEVTDIHPRSSMGTQRRRLQYAD